MSNSNDFKVDFEFRPSVNPAKGAHRAGLVASRDGRAESALSNNSFMRGKLPVNQESYIDRRPSFDRRNVSRLEYNRDYIQENSGSDAMFVGRLNRGTRMLKSSTQDFPNLRNELGLGTTDVYINRVADTCGCDPELSDWLTLRTVPTYSEYLPSEKRVPIQPR